MKKLIALLILVAGGGWMYHVWTAAPPELPQFRTLTIIRGDLTNGVTATGTIEPIQDEVGAQIVGMVKSFGPDYDKPGEMIDNNSHVRANQVLVQLDDRPFQVAVEKAAAGLRLAEAEAKQSRARLAQADRILRRAERLRGTNSTADYEAAVSNDDIAKADVDMSDAKVAEAKAAKKEADINLDYTTIRSPVDGTIISRKVGVGQTVAGPSAPSLFLIAHDLGHMHVWAAVNEADIENVHVGQKVSFKVDAYREVTFTGKVSQIRLDASMSGSVVTYGVVVDVNNSAGKLRPYMTPKLLFEVAHRSGVLLIPDQALRWQPTWSQVSSAARAGLTPPGGNKKATPGDGGSGDEATVDTGGPTVWVRAEDGLVRPVPVKLGVTDGIDTELLSGDLQPNDEVVIGAIRAAQPDFVSSFVNKVIKK